MTIADHVARFVTTKQKLGYRFTTNAKVLTSFARFGRGGEIYSFRDRSGVGIGSVITTLAR